MKKELIDLNKTGLFSQLIIDFTNKHKDVKPLVDSFNNSQSIELAISQKAKCSRNILSAVLRSQYEQTDFYDSDLSKVNRNIKLLLRENSYTITTGHQLNIFSNPLFLIYKVLSVISYTIYLNKSIPGYHFIPCFWMATEDHDSTCTGVSCVKQLDTKKSKFILQHSANTCHNSKMMFEDNLPV